MESVNSVNNTTVAVAAKENMAENPASPARKKLSIILGGSAQKKTDAPGTGTPRSAIKIRRPLAAIVNNQQSQDNSSLGESPSKKPLSISAKPFFPVVAAPVSSPSKLRIVRSPAKIAAAVITVAEEISQQAIEKRKYSHSYLLSLRASPAKLPESVMQTIKAMEQEMREAQEQEDQTPSAACCTPSPCKRMSRLSVSPSPLKMSPFTPMASPSKRRSPEDKMVELETDPTRIAQRTKQIELGRKTDGFANYNKLVQPAQRQPSVDPVEPNPNQKCSKRSWDGQVRKWRRRLHFWDTITVEADISAARTATREKEAAEALAEREDEEGNQTPKLEEESEETPSLENSTSN